MDRNKVSKKDGKVFSSNEVGFTKIEYLSDDYKLMPFSHNKITETGHLIIGKLMPRKDILPIFTFRWDEKKGELDVDINNASDDIKQKFKEGINGYKGHHTTRVIGEDERVFRANISLPDKIFQGNIKVAVHREKELVN